MFGEQELSMRIVTLPCAHARTRASALLQSDTSDTHQKTLIDDPRRKRTHIHVRAGLGNSRTLGGSMQTHVSNRTVLPCLMTGLRGDIELLEAGREDSRLLATVFFYLHKLPSLSVKHGFLASPTFNLTRGCSLSQSLDSPSKS